MVSFGYTGAGFPVAVKSVIDRFVCTNAFPIPVGTPSSSRSTRVYAWLASPSARGLAENNPPITAPEIIAEPKATGLSTCAAGNENDGAGVPVSSPGGLL